MIVWSGSIFMLQSQHRRATKPRRENLTFDSLSKPPTKQAPLVWEMPVEKIQILEEETIGLGETEGMDVVKKNQDTPEAFHYLMPDLDIPHENNEQEFELVTEKTPLSEQEQWEEIFEQASKDSIATTDDTNHEALLDELLTAHGLVLEMQEKHGYSYVEAMSRLPLDTQQVYERVGFQPEIEN